MKVLVVDDSATMRRAIRRSLGEEVEVLEASDGMEALALMEVHGRSIDLIICNMHMPRVDGLSLLRSLKGSPGYRHVPFFIVTADLSDETVRRARREGAAGVIGKPVQPDEIARLVRRPGRPPRQDPNESHDASDAGKPR